MAKEHGADKSPERAQQPDQDVQATQRTKDAPTIAPEVKHPKSNDEEDSSDEEDEEETEHHLKYTKLTGFLGQTLKGKDSASACLASGDKFIIGTHNGSVYVYALPSFDLLRSYKAHSASITAISVSPCSPSISSNGLSQDAQATADQSGERPRPPSRAPTTSSQQSTATTATSSPRSKRERPSPSGLPATPTNQIYIGTSSIDGHVCVSSLLDPKDVVLRNFARPVQSIALSPDFKSSRAYLSGGLAGHLVNTVGGKQGAAEKANTINAAAAASGWLGTMGLGSSTGHDAILHQGEGGIKAIRWSLSGRFVAWINETGVKIMRSNVGLVSEDQELAWKRIAHIDKPKRQAWDENGTLWKANIQWTEEKYLEKNDETKDAANGVPKAERRTEKLLIGWGDTVWHCNVYGEGSAARKGSAKGFKKPDVHQFTFDDGVVSGLSLYTPQLLLALIYRTKDDDDRPISSAQDTPSKGIRRRQNGMPPELRLISIASSEIEEVESDVFKLERYQSLSFADYHMSTVFFSSKAQAAKEARNTFSALGEGIWDMSKNTGRLFSSSASIMSGSSGGDVASDRRSTSTSQASIAVNFGAPSTNLSRGLPPAFTKPGLKVFVVSPFDSLLAVKRDESDHLRWLKEQKKFEAAWNYVDQHPEIVAPQQVSHMPQSRPDTPSRAHETLAEFLDDDSSSTSSVATIRAKSKLPAVAREKRIIGDLWIQQLIDANQWQRAGTIAGQVLDIADRWEYWIEVFANANKYDEISSHMPTKRMKPGITPQHYEQILQHYIENDRVRLQALLNTWSTDLFDVESVTADIQAKLDSDDPAVQKDALNDDISGRDWRILQDALAQLYLAANRPADALQCYLLTRNGDPAVDLVREHELYASIADAVYDFATIRVSPGQAASAPLAELDDLSHDPIDLLATATSLNVISTASAVSQFQEHSPAADPYLFFYFRALFNGSITQQEPLSAPARTRRRFAPTIPTNTTRQLLAPAADLAVSLFATYDAPLLGTLLRARDAADDSAAGGSLPYSFEHASAECEVHGLTAELVYLLAATGQIKEALRRICEGAVSKEIASDPDKQDEQVHWAIAFCRETDDQSLWDDLLSFSLKHPTFLRGLLQEVTLGVGGDQEVSSGLNPIDVVRQIPDGMEVLGLKTALERLLKDANVQHSIASGAAQVLRSEIMIVMEEVVARRKAGIPFEVESADEHATTLEAKDTAKSSDQPTEPQESTTKNQPTCAICADPYTHTPSPDDPDDDSTQDHLIAYHCGHVFHLNCLLDACTTPSNRKLIDELQRRLEVTSSELQDGSDAGWRRGRVGSKVARMQMIGRIIGGRECVRCERDERKKNET